MKKKNIVILSLLFLNLMSLSLLMPTKNAELPKLRSSNIMTGVTIDGNINEAAWNDARHKLEFWMDVDTDNVDAYNYLYVGEDENNLYIALDLCSDITGNSIGEWVGVWLITNNRTFTNQAQWENYNNDGTELLLYNVSGQDVWNTTLDGAPSVGGGTIFCIESTIYNFELEYGFSSSPNNSTNHRIFEFKIPKSEVELYDPNGYLGIYVGGYGTMSFGGRNYWAYPYDTSKEFQEELSSEYEYLYMKDSDIPSFITIDGRINESIWDNVDHKVKFWIDADVDNTDAYNYLYVGEGVYNLYIALDLCSDTTNSTVGEWVGVWLITSNRVFSGVSQWKNYNNNGTECIVYNVTADDIWNQTLDGQPHTSVDCSNTTINSFELKWGFFNSSNNGTVHRIFEIRIPKHEIEGYDSNGYLGILVGGYGTLSIQGTNYWVYPIGPFFDEEYSIEYLFLNMKDSGVPSQIPGYDLYVIFGIVGISSVVVIIFKRTRKLGASS